MMVNMVNHGPMLANMDHHKPMLVNTGDHGPMVPLQIEQHSLYFHSVVVAVYGIIVSEGYTFPWKDTVRRRLDPGFLSLLSFLNCPLRSLGLI